MIFALKIDNISEFRLVAVLIFELMIDYGIGVFQQQGTDNNNKGFI